MSCAKLRHVECKRYERTKRTNKRNILFLWFLCLSVCPDPSYWLLYRFGLYSEQHWSINNKNVNNGFAVVFFWGCHLVCSNHGCCLQFNLSLRCQKCSHSCALWLGMEGWISVKMDWTSQVTVNYLLLASNLKDEICFFTRLLLICIQWPHVHLSYSQK